MHPQYQLLRRLTPLLGLILLLGCSEDTPTSLPEPELAPKAPEPTPAPLEDVRLYHVQLHERLTASHMPVLSPLDGVGRSSQLPHGFIASADISAAGGAEAVAEQLKQLEKCRGASGSAIALIEWNVRWGDSAGRARFWGACALPCTVDESFVATAGHYPLDPVLHPLAMFAHRPGHAPLSLTEVAGGLEVQQGVTLLWAEGAPVTGGVWSEEVELLWLRADLAEVTEKRVEATRSLAVTKVQQKIFPLVESAPLLAQSIVVLPELPELNAAAKPRAVEGVQELWPWPEANRFEGGFVARPNPADFGLRLDRPGQQILWTPTLRQAVDGKADFVTHELMRTGGIKTTVSPFPGGAEVLGAVSLLEGRVVLASGKAGYDEQPRAQEVKRFLLRFEDMLPIPERKPEAGPAIIYLSDEPAGLVEGSAGPADHAFVVSSTPGEEHSVARAWSRIVLGAHSAVRSFAADDLALWFEGELLRGLQSKELGSSTLGQAESSVSQSVTGLLAPVFADAGDDIIGEWKYRVRGPKHAGEPDPSAFLSYIGTQLPEIERDVRRAIALRAFSQDWEGPSIGISEDGTRRTLSLRALRGNHFWGTIPAGGDAMSWTIRVTPSTPGVAPRWSWAAVPRSVWEGRGRSEEAAAAVLGRLGPTQGSDLQRAPAPAAKRAVRRAPPSQLKHMSGPRTASQGSPSEAAQSGSSGSADADLMAPLSEVLVERSAADTEELVVYVLLWSPEASEVELELVPSSPEAEVVPVGEEGAPMPPEAPNSEEG